MGIYKKILVAIDGSASGMHALKESFKFADGEKSWITVTSVIPRYEGDLSLVGLGDTLSAMKRPCTDVLRKAEAIARAEGALIKTVCEEGEIYSRIIDLSDAEHCDLIVMGRRGLRRLEKVLMGSVTARVVGHSQKDVLIVPSDGQIGWERILIATDGSQFSKAASEKAIGLAKSYGGRLVVVSVVDVPPELYGESADAVEGLIKKAKGYTEDTKRQAETEGVQSEVFVREGEAFKIITDLARDEKMDLIVIGSHGRTGLKRLLMGSVTEKVIGHAACPVLVVKA